MEYKNNGGLQKIELLLPVIELRIKEFVGNGELNKINYHIIFADNAQLKIEQIEAQFLTGLKGKAILNEEYNEGYSWAGVITPQTLEDFGKHIYDKTPQDKKNCKNYIEIGFNNICFELAKISELLGEKSEPNSFLNGKYLKAMLVDDFESMSAPDILGRGKTGDEKVETKKNCKKTCRI